MAICEGGGSIICRGLLEFVLECGVARLPILPWSRRVERAHPAISRVTL